MIAKTILLKDLKDIVTKALDKVGTTKLDHDLVINSAKISYKNYYAEYELCSSIVLGYANKKSTIVGGLDFYFRIIPSKKNPRLKIFIKYKMSTIMNYNTCCIDTSNNSITITNNLQDKLENLFMDHVNKIIPKLTT